MERLKQIVEYLNGGDGFPSPVSDDMWEHYFVEPLFDKYNREDIAADQGISKGVILLKGCEWVLKIPFEGRYCESDFEDAYAGWEEADDPNLPEPHEADFFDPFQFATMPDDTEDRWNYCELECRLYQAAIEQDVARYFAEEYYLGKIKNHPVYYQKRVTFSQKEYSKERTRSTSERCRELEVPCFDAEWITDFFDAYGEEEFIRLSNFLSDYGIYDLHSGNLGYLNGLPIILDYASYEG